MINEALRLIRVFHGVKSNELAKSLGISPSYLSGIESGNKKPTPEIIVLYANFFDIRVPAIMFFSESIDRGTGARTIKTIRGLMIKFLKIVESLSGEAEQ